MSISYKFYSWFSSSDSKGKEWTYIYSENINTFSSEYIEVSPKTKTLISTGEKIDYLVPSYEVNNDFYFVRKNKIFNQNNNIVYEHWNGLPNKDRAENKIWFAINYTNWPDFYALVQGIKQDKTDFEWSTYYVQRINRNYIENINRAQLNYYPAFNILPFHFLIDWGFLYIAWPWLIKVDINNFTSPYIFLLKAANFSINSDWLKIFTRDGFLVFSTWVTDAGKWNETQEWQKEKYYIWNNVKTWKILSGIDYLFCDEWLFFLNWIILTPIYFKNKSNYLDFEKFNFFPWRYWVIKNDNLIFSLTKTSKWFDLNVLWSKVVWSPINFSSILSKDWDEVLSMTSYKDGVLILYRKWRTYGVDFFSLNSTEKEEKWYLITKEYYNESLSNRKKAKKLRIYCDKFSDWEYLKISASINNQPFFDIKTITRSDDWKDWFFEIFSFNKEFHKIVFKLELKWNYKLYDFIFYDEIIK